jgi:hypothetical protein
VRHPSSHIVASANAPALLAVLFLTCNSKYRSKDHGFCCHRGMAHPQVAVNILNEHSRIADNGCFSSMIGSEANNSP